MASNTSASLFAAPGSTALTFMGGWDASTGAFPAGGAALTGFLYKVTVAGTVDGIPFAVDDSLYAVTNGASATTYFGNWVKVASTANVASVFGRAGSVTADEGDYSLGQASDVDTTTVPPVAGDVLKFSAGQWRPGTSSGAVYSGEVATAAARLALTDSPGQTAWQQDGGSLHRGAMYQQIRTPGSSNANWVLIGEQTFDVSWDGTITTFDSTGSTYDRTA